MKIVPQNIKSLFASFEKLDNAVLEIEEVKLGMSSVQWPRSVRCNTRNSVMYFSGNDDRIHCTGGFSCR